MITVEYDKKACALCVQGHAGSAAAGRDLVCAACSMLVYGLAQALMDLCPPPRSIAPGYEVKLDTGDARIAWTPEKPWDRARARLIFAAYTSGFRALAREHPDYVRYSEK